MDKLPRETIISSDRHTPTIASPNGTKDTHDERTANVDFGRLVAARRTSLGLSQEDLAARMGTSQSSVERIEAGQPPSIEALERLGAALHVGPRTGALRRSLARAIASGKGALSARRAGVGLAAAIAAALWIALIAGGERGAGIGLAVASMTTLFFSVFITARRTKPHAPAAILGALWLSLFGVGLISNAGGPVSDGIDAVLAPLGAGARADDGEGGAVLGLVASGGGQSREAGGAQDAASLPPSGDLGRCASPGRPGKREVIGNIHLPWTGVVISYPSRACGFESRITIAGVRANSPGHGVYAGTGSAPSADQGGSPSADQGGSPGTHDTANNVGNTANNVGNTANNAGNTANNVGNTVNNVGNTVNNVGNTVKETVGGAGNILKGLGG